MCRWQKWPRLRSLKCEVVFATCSSKVFSLTVIEQLIFATCSFQVVFANCSFTMFSLPVLLMCFCCYMFLSDQCLFFVFFFFLLPVLVKFVHYLFLFIIFATCSFEAFFATCSF